MKPIPIHKRNWSPVLFWVVLILVFFTQCADAEEHKMSAELACASYSYPRIRCEGKHVFNRSPKWTVSSFIEGEKQTTDYEKGLVVYLVILKDKWSQVCLDYRRTPTEHDTLCVEARWHNGKTQFRKVE